MLIVVVVVCMFTGTALAQDDITPLVDEGRKALAAGNYQEALALFQQVVQQIQSKMSQSLEKFIPPAPAGWEADDIESQTWAGSTNESSHNMIYITREYKRQSDGVECAINITNWPQIVQAMTQSFAMYKQMGDMMNVDPNTKISMDEIDGWQILKVVSTESETAIVNAAYNKLMVTVEVDRDDIGIADEFLNKVDLKGLGGSAQ